MTTKTATKQSALEVQVAGSHYKDLKIQPIEYIHANQLGYCDANGKIKKPESYSPPDLETFI